MSSDEPVTRSWTDVDLPTIASLDPDPRQIIRTLLSHGRVTTLKTLAKLKIDPVIGRRREARRRMCYARTDFVLVNGWHDVIAGYREIASKT